MQIANTLWHKELCSHISVILGECNTWWALQRLTADCVPLLFIPQQWHMIRANHKFSLGSALQELGAVLLPFYLILSSCDILSRRRQLWACMSLQEGSATLCVTANSQTMTWHLPYLSISGDEEVAACSLYVGSRTDVYIWCVSGLIVFPRNKWYHNTSVWMNNNCRMIKEMWC